ncbi:indole-3-glycerol phosphate synthase TrpC [Bacillota bacterium LX-D]|nr:indole-3-glycerol phosphate synthase TrpC [Bacillota bacterium LX-D]
MILDEIVLHKKKQLVLEKEQTPLQELQKKIAFVEPARDFYKALTKDKGINIIGEIKKASPSKGILKENFQPREIAQDYQRGNVDAISILTEQKYFLGADQFIGEVKPLVDCPLLRKDFIVDEYQIYQSKVLGADAVLLIVAVIGKNLKHFYQLATALGLHCLVEVHDEKELEIALEANVPIIGINNRNLHDFTVSLKNTEKLITTIPAEVVKVSESGIHNLADMQYLNSLGVDAVLIGEAFMKAGQIKDLLAELKMG